MNINKIRGLALALAMLSAIGTSFANNGDQRDKETELLIDTLNIESHDAYLEAFGLTREQKIFVYYLNGELVFEANESDLKADHYRTIFQSDFIMEYTGNRYYIMLTTEKPPKINF